jgi:hypothetical protein
LPEDLGRKHSVSKSADRLALALGIGNFVVVSVLGAFFTWRTQDLESRLSTIGTAAPYIQLVASSDAPAYAKSLALSAIFSEGLLSRDVLLETAYRLEDENLERSIVGPLLFQIAQAEELLELPFGYMRGATSQEAEDGGGVELRLEGWALDDDGWASGRPSDGSAPMLQIEMDGNLSCQYPAAAAPGCQVELAPRPDIQRIFRGYPSLPSRGEAPRSSRQGTDHLLPLRHSPTSHHRSAPTGRARRPGRLPRTGQLGQLPPRGDSPPILAGRSYPSMPSWREL